ncbi:hypothetical protein [Staphylococcus epidermidis]|uniref:hypothetical protein n=1 Tax=Staphylococcus epidermidis TaxID=1282 RepID=UPI002874D2C9|nr:hypothetical protein [Staphylococcus epidermidis]MDS0998460.1 hypothetical protein [Staphylococcus epidermidis]
MKKLLTLIIATFLVLTACSSSSDDNNSESEKSETKSSSTTTSDKSKSKPVINEDKLKDFAKSIYDADTKKDIQYLDELADDNVKSILTRKFQRADLSKSKDFDRTAGNVKLYKKVDDSNRYLATLEVKTRDTKEKQQTWLQKTLEFRIKDGKVNQFEEVGSRDIYNEQD